LLDAAMYCENPAVEKAAIAMAALSGGGKAALPHLEIVGQEGPGARQGLPCGNSGVIYGKVLT